ncbi:phage terminase small subunit P27 family [Nocardioides sp. STR2]|uniref:Phage terminase small subunit P27 family n=1 Tax=Nocardioides pini TaxID=2975053 RepID=A0ABT4CCL8_9ACTN|nr:phage terminase small subunit P27 family [Nocardioides pini]MCY4726710.1 phage terminase small subunit P27 family [Nocardioides pini]
MAQAQEPANLRLLKGRGDGRDSGGRKVEQGPGFKRTPPHPPIWLEGEALDVWRRITPELTRLDLLKEGDAEVLATYCETWVDFVEATATIKREGYYIDARQGTLKHPAVGIKHAAAKELRAIAAHFGLTPSTEQALARGGADDNDAENPFD